MVYSHDCDLELKNGEYQPLNVANFYTLFKEVINEIQEENKEEIKDIYSSSNSWTRTLLPVLGEKIHSRFPLDTETEYFRIDLIGYSSAPKKAENSLGLNRHFWNLELALEHENDKKDWLDEVAKLAHIKCGLKIVISYVDDNHDKDTEKLRFVKNNILDKLKCENMYDGEENWLFIFGTCDFPDGILLDGYRAYTFGKSTDSEIVQLK